MPDLQNSPILVPAAGTSSYRDHFLVLEEHLNGMRDSFYHERRSAAMASFERQGFPGRKDEAWKYTPVGNLTRNPLIPARAARETNMAVSASSFLPDFIANRLVFVNGRFDAGASKIIDQGAFTIGSLSETVRSNPDEVASWFDGLHHPGWSAFAMLNTALYRDGAWIHVRQGAVVTHPILILDLADALTHEEVMFPRHLLVAEAGSSVRVVHFHGDGHNIGAVYRSFPVSEIFVERGARVSLDVVQESAGDYQIINTTEVRQDRDSHFTARTFCLGGQLIRNDLRVRFAGENAECDLDGLYLAQDQDLVDNHLLVDHAHPQCRSNQLYKGIADGGGTAVFNGVIYVQPNAQKTNAYQSNKNLLLSQNATINTKPQLEIFADDVRCSHGATSGQLDPESLFYLMARGIPAPEAKTMLLQAFAAEILLELPDDGLREYLSHRIAARLNQTAVSTV